MGKAQEAFSRNRSYLRVQEILQKGADGLGRHAGHNVVVKDHTRAKALANLGNPNVRTGRRGKCHYANVWDDLAFQEKRTGSGQKQDVADALKQTMNHLRKEAPTCFDPFCYDILVQHSTEWARPLATAMPSTPIKCDTDPMRLLDIRLPGTAVDNAVQLIPGMKKNYLKTATAIKSYGNI